MAQLNKVVFPTEDYIIDTHTYYGTSVTGASTVNKKVTCADFTMAMTDCPAGTSVRVKFNYGNTAAAPTLNVNSKGAKPIIKYGTTEPGTSKGCSWRDGAVVTFTYDGTNWIMNDVNDFAETIYMTDTNPSSGTWYNLVFTDDIVADTPYYLRGTDGARVYLKNGTESNYGYTVLTAGNNIASGTAGNNTGLIRLYARDTTKYAQLKADPATAANVDHTFPGTAGTILNTGTTSYTQSYSGGTKIGTIKINNSSTDIYAPSAGSTYYYNQTSSDISVANTTQTTVTQIANVPAGIYIAVGKYECSNPASQTNLINGYIYAGNTNVAQINGDTKAGGARVITTVISLGTDTTVSLKVYHDQGSSKLFSGVLQLWKLN